ncbi:hypothetical protein DZB91_23400 [Brevibacillus sp. VP]|uniref:hypothetical protein n=1 Tax=Brevibacillus sp. VP TaxID=2293326 RepID=UPI000E2E57C4|nr:hypothetical protein [Brevibacillus sp. VP]RFB28389.1 hypothetical protein DZB91_23400 [Brevibacillus sp. VP]
MGKYKSVFSAFLVASLALTGCTSKEPPPQEVLMSNYLQALIDQKEDEAYSMVSVSNPPTKEVFVSSNVRAPIEFFKVVDSKCADDGVSCDVKTEIKYKSSERANDKNIINITTFKVVKENDKWLVSLDRTKPDNPNELKKD